MCIPLFTTGGKSGPSRVQEISRLQCHHRGKGSGEGAETAEGDSRFSLRGERLSQEPGRRKRGVKRRHLDKDTREAVVKAVEEPKAPLKPLLKELGISRSSYY